MANVFRPGLVLGNFFLRTFCVRPGIRRERQSGAFGSAVAWEYFAEPEVDAAEGAWNWKHAKRAGQRTPSALLSAAEAALFLACLDLLSEPAIYRCFRCHPARPSIIPPSAASATTIPASAMMLTSGALNAESDHTGRQR